MTMRETEQSLIDAQLQEALRNERKLNGDWLDIEGIIDPQEPMETPEAAFNCLLTIRRISGFIERVISHIDCGGLEFESEDIKVLGQLAGCIRQASGYLVEYIEGEVRPKFDYEGHSKKWVKRKMMEDLEKTHGKN
ncbi:MAG: hypothetical protein WB930_16095 [Syntrophobacteraceae bacterium]